MTTTFDWNFRNHISILKGAKLPTLLALMLHSNLNLRCYPSTLLLCDETGLSSAPVTSALQELEAMKAIIKVPYDKRLKGESGLPKRKSVFQLTGIIHTEELKTRYLSIAHLNEETLDNLVYIISDIDAVIGKEVCDILESEISDSKILLSKSKGSTSSKGSTAIKDKKHLPAQKHAGAEHLDKCVVCHDRDGSIECHGELVCEWCNTIMEGQPVGEEAFEWARKQIASLKHASDERPHCDSCKQQIMNKYYINDNQEWICAPCYTNHGRLRQNEDNAFYLSAGTPKASGDELSDFSHQLLERNAQAKAESDKRMLDTSEPTIEWTGSVHSNTLGDYLDGAELDDSPLTDEEARDCIKVFEEYQQDNALTAEQAAVLEGLLKGDGRYTKAPTEFSALIKLGYCAYNTPSLPYETIYITDTGRTALEAYKDDPYGEYEPGKLADGVYAEQVPSDKSDKWEALRIIIESSGEFDIDDPYISDLLKDEYIEPYEHSLGSFYVSTDSGDEAFEDHKKWIAIKGKSKRGATLSSTADLAAQECPVTERFEDDSKCVRCGTNQSLRWVQYRGYNESWHVCGDCHDWIRELPPHPKCNDCGRNVDIENENHKLLANGELVLCSECCEPQQLPDNFKVCYGTSPDGSNMLHADVVGIRDKPVIADEHIGALCEVPAKEAKTVVHELTGDDPLAIMSQMKSFEDGVVERIKTPVTPAKKARKKKEINPDYQPLFAAIHKVWPKTNDKIPKSINGMIGKAVNGLLELGAIPGEMEALYYYVVNDVVKSDVFKPPALLTWYPHFKNSDAYKRHVAVANVVPDVIVDSDGGKPTEVITPAMIAETQRKIQEMLNRD